MARPPTLPDDASPMAREVFRRMIDAGFGPKTLSLRAGLNETYVRDLLKGRSKNPKSYELRQLAEALGCAVADLAGPRMAHSDAPSGEFIDSPSELSLIRLWRTLGPTGRQLVLLTLSEMLSKTPGGRQTNNG